MPKKRKVTRPRRSLPAQPGLESRPAPPAPVQEQPTPRPSSLAGKDEYAHVRQDLKRIALYAAFLFAGLGVLRIVLG